MAKVVGDIAIGVTADIGPLVREMGRATRATGGLARATDKVSRKLNGFSRKTARLGKTMSVVSGAIAGAAAATFALAKSTADAGDKIAKTARGAGVSAQYYQEMAYAIGQVSDVSEDELASSLQRLTRSIGEGAEGAKAQSEALEKLGFTQSQIASGSITTQQAFDAYIKTMDGIKDPAIAAAISSDLLGRSGVRLGAQLAGAGGNVASLRDRANELGIVLSKDALDASEQFGDKMDDLTRSFQAVKTKIGAELLPLFVDRLIPAIQDRVIPKLIEFGDAIGGVIDWFDNLAAPVQEAIGIVAGALGVGGPLLLAVSAVSKAFALLLGTGPIGAFILAATAAAFAWAKWGDDIKAGIGGAVDWIKAKFEAFLEYMRGLPAMLVEIGANMIQGILDGINAKWEELKAKILELGTLLPQWLRDMLDIQSPSRVFAEIGGYIGQGLAQGIAESQALVEQAVSTLGGAAVKGSETTAQGVLANMQTMFEGNKKLSAGIALANSWLAFTEVLKDPALVGRPFARIAAAGAALTAGLKAVKSINAAKPGGSGGGGSSGGSAAAAQAAPQPTMVNIAYSGAFNEASMGSLTEKLNSEYDQGYLLKFVSG